MLITKWIRSRSMKALTSAFISGMLGVGVVLPMNASIAHAEMTSNSNVQEYITLSDHLVALRRAIIGQESGSNFRAVNPHSGALGYGQVMPANVANWSREALGRSVSQADFLNSPEVQLRVIDFKLNQYWQDAWAASGGDVSIAIRQVASRWYSGNPRNYTSTAPEFYNGRRYPSIAEYSFSILQRYVGHVRGMRTYTY